MLVTIVSRLIKKFRQLAKGSYFTTVHSAQPFILTDKLSPRDISPCTGTPSSCPNLCIPQTFIDRYLWNPETSTTSSAYFFDTKFLAELYIAFDFAFNQSSRPWTSYSKDTDASGPAIVLYHPQSGATSITDALVNLVSRELLSDILVLDSLDLAFGLQSTLGEACRSLQHLYTLKTYANDEDAPIVKDVVTFFERLLSIPSTRTRRIIYFRDFTAISRTAIPLVACILKAIDNLKHTKNVNFPALIIVFGVSKPISESSVKAEGMFLTFTSPQVTLRQPKDLIPSHSKLWKRILPGFGSKCSYSRHFSSLRNLSSHILTSWLPENVGTTDVSWPGRDRAVQLWNQALCFEVRPLDANSPAFRLAVQTEINLRCQVMSNAMLNFALGDHGASLQDALSYKFPLEEVDSSKLTRQADRYYFRILSPSAAATMATLATGSIRSMGSSIQEIDFDTIQKAYVILSASMHRNTAWLPRHRGGHHLHDSNEMSDDDMDELMIEPENQDATKTIPALPLLPLPILPSFPTGNMKTPGFQDERDRATGARVTNSNPQDSHKALLSQLNTAIPRLSRYESHYLGNIVNIQQLKTSSRDIRVDPDIVNTLSTIVSLPLSYPGYFRQGILKDEAISGILLYGPPGTGKTMVCRALAKECGANMISVKPSDINEMCVGETEKKINGLFELAARLSPCVIFIDEVDAIFRSRRADDKAWQVTMLAEFMQAMDGLNSRMQNETVIVIGATNRPYDIDEAILRRLPSRLLVDLPEEDTREDILRIYLDKENLDDDVDIREIALMAEDYSGSDLKNLCVSAALSSVKEAIGGEFEGKSLDQFKNVSIPSTGNVEESKHDLPPRIIRQKNLLDAFQAVRPSYNAEANKALRKWHEELNN